MGELDGRVALVTGGGRGIGRGISDLLGAQGAAVAVNYRRDEAAAQDTVAAILAHVVAWLCSPGAGYLTGQRIECDGGGNITSY